MATTMITVATAALTLLVTGVGCLDNGLALSPPMGWMTGERFECNVDCRNYPDDCISESLVKSMADTMTNNPYIERGYKYLLVGDCWQANTRDSQGRLQANSTRFPSGIKSTADYLHQRGLKLGLYLEAGNVSSHGYPGSQGHYQQDAQMLADWGVDMLTLDAHSITDLSKLDSIFPEMGGYLNQTRRQILYSCYWPLYQLQTGRQVNFDLVSRTCNMFRTYPDMQDSWDFKGLLDLIKFYGDTPPQHVRNYTGPGRWNDVNQVLIGNYGLSYNQQQMVLSVWSILAAPLFVSADLRRIRDDSRSLLLSQEAIQGIDQDKLGLMGYQHSKLRNNGQVRIWRRSIQPDGSFALAFTYENISGGPARISVLLSDIGLTTAAAYNFTDGFTGAPMGLYKPWHTYNGEANPTGVRLIRATALP